MGSGRYWNRTSDPYRVKVVLIKIGTPGLEPSTGTGAYKNGKFERLRMASRTSHNSWLMNGLVSSFLSVNLLARIGV